MPPRKKHPGGRPSEYDKKKHPKQYEKLRLLGLTDEQCANVFGIGYRTLQDWKANHVEFSRADARAKDALGTVAVSLYKRACGYKHPDVDIRVIDGQIVKTRLTKHYPPDTAAAKFILINRDREHWQERIEQEITGKDGGAIAVIERVIIKPAEQTETDVKTPDSNS